MRTSEGVSPISAGSAAASLILFSALYAALLVLFVVAARLTRFGPLFVVMLLYSLCFGATLPLVNALMFRHLTDATAQSPAPNANCANASSGSSHFTFVWTPKTRAGFPRYSVP